MDAMSIASGWMLSASQRFAASAQAVVSGRDDPVAGLIGVAESKTTFAAAAQVMKASDRITGRLLNMVA